MQFKHYRKTTPTLARPLTQEDYQQRAGIIQTREGPASFRVGDYLALDRAGEYPILQEMLERNYQYHSSAHGPHEGWNWYHPLDLREAAQMVEPFDLNGQHGQAGDYIVKRAEHQWIVAREIFEAAYLLVEERSV